MKLKMDKIIKKYLANYLYKDGDKDKELTQKLKDYGFKFKKKYAITIGGGVIYYELDTQQEILDKLKIKPHLLERYMTCQHNGWEFWTKKNKWFGLKGYDEKLYVAKDKSWLAYEMKIDIKYITSFEWFDKNRIVIEPFWEWELKGDKNEY